MFHFRGPSHIGDRLVLKAIVNNTFKKRYVYIKKNCAPLGWLWLCIFTIQKFGVRKFFFLKKIFKKILLFSKDTFI